MIDLGHAHPYLLLFGAVGSIIFVAIWPEIQHLFPKLPPTMHDRIHLVETSAADHATRLSSVEGRWNNSKVAEILPDHEARLLVQAGCLQKIASLALWMDDVALLIHEAVQCHASYPKSTTKIRLSSFSRPAMPIAPKVSVFVGFTVAEESPDFAAICLRKTTILHITHEAGLINRHDGTQAHGYGRELPEVRHHAGMWIG